MAGATGTDDLPGPLPPDVDVAATLDGGTMDCGSGLLLAITRGMRGVEVGQVVVVRTEEPSVCVDLPAWARLAGHTLAGADTAEDGAWRIAVRRGADPRTVPYSTGDAPPLGSRLWLYSNFDCNLACHYCCAESSPRAAARRLPVEVAASAVDEFADLGGQEVLVTGGEPFLHPDLDAIVAKSAARLPVTLLTNAMVFGRGRRRDMLESMDRERVTLQVSLDSADPALHDAQRGRGAFDRARAGMKQARESGFRVRVAATLYDDEPRAAEIARALHRLLESDGIPAADRLIRPVAREGFADRGVAISLESLAPEPTLTADGAWWHPVAVTDPHLRVADSPLPVSEVFAVVASALMVQDASARSGRSVFRCT